jgi:hypothetical protein
MTVSESGVFHFSISTHFDTVRGVTLTTGKKFVSSSIATNEFTIAKGSEDTSTLSGHFTVSGESSLVPDDFFMHQTVHFTVSANGVPTATVSNIRSGCR